MEVARGPGTAVAEPSHDGEFVREQTTTILALNETRKTLLASRLHVSAALSEIAQPLAPMLPGDGVWIRSLGRGALPDACDDLDLVFLDSDRRVLATISPSNPEADRTALGNAVELLELAPGTIDQTRTARGDRIVLDPI